MRRTPTLIATAAIAVTLAGCGGATYQAEVTKYDALDAAHLGVTIAVTNTGSSAGTPTCFIEGINTRNDDIGTDDVTMKGTLGPGRTTHFADSFVITNQGAKYVTIVATKCN